MGKRKNLWVVGAAILVSSFAQAQSLKYAPDMMTMMGGGSTGFTRVVVQTVPGGLQNFVAGLPGTSSVSATLSNLNMVVINVPTSLLPLLANNSSVSYISADRPLSQLLDYSAAAVNAAAVRAAGFTGAGIGVAIIDSGVANLADFSGGIGVSRVVYREDFTGNTTTGYSNQVSASNVVMGGAVGTATRLNNNDDGFGHGTHVAGIVAGNGASSTCMNCMRSLPGIAPAANILDLKVLDSNGSGTDSSVLAAINRAIQLKQTYNIRVINLSLGRPIYESYTNDPLCKAVEAAWKAGIVVDVAAGNAGRDNQVGNQGYGTIQSPANDPYVITVGAMKAMGTFTRTDDLIASYSSKGPSGIDFVVKPDVVAPGNHVVSLQSQGSTLAQEAATAVPLSYYEATTSNTTSTAFTMLNGTSMATPVVSGAVADLLQAEPLLTPDQVKAKLMKSAYKTFPKSSTAVDPVSGQMFTSYYDLFTIGAGYLDLQAALANKDVAQGTALSPIAKLNTANNQVYLFFDASSIWGATANQAIWGAQAVWGTTTVTPAQAIWGTSSVIANQAIWGTQAIWGASNNEASSAVWGSKGVWGTETDQSQSSTSGSSAVWGTKAVWGASSSTSDSDQTFTVTP